MTWSFKKAGPAVVGVAVADGQLWAVPAAHGNAGVEVGAPTVAPLAAEPREADALAGAIKAQFDAAKLKQRHVVVALPPAAVMSVHTRLPAGLPADDVASLLRIEAEKALPCDPDELQIAISRQKTAAAEYATQLAVRREYLAKLSAALRATGLRPVSYSLGFDALPGAIPAAGQGRITLALEGTAATLLISAGGGIAAFRTFDVPPQAGGRAIAREMRITLEQVPEDLRREVRALHLLGDASLGAELAAAATEWATQSGLTIEGAPATPAGVGVALADAVARRHVATGAADMEFLPARPSRWATMTARYNSPRLATAGFSAAGVAVLALLAFGWHEYRHWSLARQWDAMATQVKDLTAINDRVREYQPFYDTSFRNLTVLRRVVECFPEDGSVSAKSVEIHGNGAITITGTASDNGALLHTEDQLGRTREVHNLHTDQIRGKTPAQFSFTFRWVASTGS